MSLQVITANRLDNGLAVFYNASGEWHTNINQATTLDDVEKGETLLKQASSPENQLIVVGPYLIEVEEGEGGLSPVRYREMIRTKGPSVRPDLGYQAQ